MVDVSCNKIMAAIPLRAGSKGLPNKNLLPLDGKPLYRHAVDQALRVVGQCVITTDIAELHKAEMPKGCMVVERPEALAQDTTPMTPVLSHLFNELEQSDALPETVVLLQATSPLRSDEDVQGAIDLYAQGNNELVMSVTETDAGVLKYGFINDGQFTAVSRPEYCFYNRQSLPDLVRPNGAVYVFSPQVFRKNGGLSTSSIGAVEMPQSRSIDIDSAADMNLAEVMFAEPASRLAG